MSWYCPYTDSNILRPLGQYKQYQFRSSFPLLANINVIAFLFAPFIDSTLDASFLICCLISQIDPTEGDLDSYLSISSHAFSHINLTRYLASKLSIFQISREPLNPTHYFAPLLAFFPWRFPILFDLTDFIYYLRKSSRLTLKISATLADYVAKKTC